MPATILPRRDVDVNLTYWKGANKEEVIDFSKPGAEKEYQALESRDEPYKTTVQDVRGRENEFTLDNNGFTYAKHEIEGLDACTSEEEYQKLIVPATEELVKELTGAHKTIVFTSRIRNVSQDNNKRDGNKAPALSVHSDFSPEGGRQNFTAEVADAAEREQLAEGRVLHINVWRPLKTITKDPLAVCDWKTVDAESDIIPLVLQMPHKTAHLGKWRHTAKHQWYYLHRQRPDEPLVFVQHDNRDPSGVTVPHTAFEDEEYASGPPRQSIEIKMLAFVK